MVKLLRGLGFMHHEIWVLAGCKGSESNLRRDIGSVKVEDSAEHDKLLKILADFSASGHKLEDIDEVNKNKLTAKNIRENMDLNKDLNDRGINPDVQIEIQKAVEKFGEPRKIMQAFNEFESTISIGEEIKVLERKKEEVSSGLKQDEALHERNKLEALTHQTYMDTVRLLSSDYHFDYASLENLLGLAKKFGSPLLVLGAVNVYGDLKELNEKVGAKSRDLEVLEAKYRAEDAEYTKLVKLNQEANRVLGEIKANHDTSMQLQLISKLLREPELTSVTLEGLARVSIALLEGVAINAKKDPQLPTRFKTIVNNGIEPVISDLQNFLRGK